MNFLIFRYFFGFFLNLKLIYLILNQIYKCKDEVAKYIASDRAMNRDRRSSLKPRGYVAQSYSSANCFKMI